MSASMFCPRCRALLKPIKRGGSILKVCGNCGYSEGGADRKPGGETPAPNPIIRAPHPEFPLLPYMRVRDGQREFMKHLRTAVQTGKILVAQAPTGIGKTAATLSVLLEDAMPARRLVFFLTSKQSQHRIVIDTLRLMNSLAPRPVRAVDMTSKQSMCYQARAGMPGYAFVEFCRGMVRSGRCRLQGAGYDMAVERLHSRIMHVHELVKLARDMGICPHRLAGEAMANADVVVCDYNHIFDVMAEQVLDRAARPLGGIDLVVDEAHNLPARIRDNMSMELTSFKMDEAVREARKAGGAGAGYTADLRAVLDRWSEELPPGGETYVDPERLTRELDRIFAQHLGGIDQGGYVEWLHDVGRAVLKRGADISYAEELAEFLERWGDEPDMTVRILARKPENTWSLKLCFLDPGQVSGPVFGSVHCAVLMSGTLYPPEMYANVLEVPPERRMLHAYESPFPPENKLVLAVGGVTTRYVRRGRGMDRLIAEYIQALSGSARGNVAAFFPSYGLMQGTARELAGMVRDRDMLVEEQGMSKRARETYLRRLAAGQGRGLLLAVQGGSLSEGIDYHDNLLAAVAVVGIPLAPPNLEVKALREHYTGKFGREKGELYAYLAPALNKVVQGAGRLIRSETDRGIIVLMDERFLQSRYMKLLPPDLRPEPVKNPEHLASAVREFFAGPE